MHCGHKIHLETAIIIHDAVKLGRWIIGSKDTGVQKPRELLEPGEVGRRFPDHEVEIESRHWRAVEGRSGIADQDSLDAAFSECPGYFFQQWSAIH